MNVTVTRLDASALVEVSGEIDITTVTEFDDALSDLGVSELVVDLTEVTFMDTSGIHALLRLSQRVFGEDGEVQLVVVPQSPVHLLLKLTGLSDQFTIVESSDDASEALPQNQR